MKTRILTAIAIIAIVIYPVMAGGYWLMALAMVILACSAYEWAHAQTEFKSWGIWPLLIMEVCVLAGLFFDAKYTFPITAAGLMALWSIPVFTKKMHENSSLVLMAGFAFLMAVAYSFKPLFNSPQYLWSLILATSGSDTGAYFTGMLLGKHKMNPRISPKKTWEGFFGGWIIGFALSFGISLIYLNAINPQINFAVCLIAPITAELGDLCFSAYKRAYNLKDFSHILPGHGGILDRVDSLMMNILLFGILVSVM